MADNARLNLPDADNLVLCTSRQVLTVRAEADAANVKIAILRKAGVLQVLDLLTTFDVEYLS